MRNDPKKRLDSYINIVSNIDMAKKYDVFQIFINKRFYWSSLFLLRHFLRVKFCRYQQFVE